MLEKTWYYLHQEQQYGPVAESQLKGLLGNRSIPSDALVWSNDIGGEWAPANSHNLVAPLAQAPNRASARQATSGVAVSAHPADRPSTLKYHMSQGLPIDQAVNNYVNEMLQKYPPVNPTSPLQTAVKFQWKITYYSANQMFFTVLMHILGGLVGIRFSRYSIVRFSTYHLLNKNQVMSLRLKGMAKGAIYPLLVLIMLFAGVVAFIAILISVIGAFSTPKTPMTWQGFMTGSMIIGGAIAIWALFYYLSSLMKGLGYPPNADDLKARLVALEKMTKLKIESLADPPLKVR